MVDFKGKDILSTADLQKDQVEFILQTAEDFLPVARKEKTSNVLEGKLMAALFYEPSTRTRLSFETAMQRLGGRVITAVGMEYSSLKKGETLEDTAKVIENYVDVIVMRHPEVGSVKVVAENASIPVINAGDGSGEHPSQALLDLFTIRKEHGKIDGLTIAMVGDLKFGRTVHSLIPLLSQYKVKFILVAPEVLRMPKDIVLTCQKNGIEIVETEKIEEALTKADVVYSTRVQQERFSDLKEYERLKHAYILSRELIEKCNSKITIMHPLPRIGELLPDVDVLPGAAYFRQVQNGVAVRMALLSLVLGVKNM